MSTNHETQEDSTMINNEANNETTAHALAVAEQLKAEAAAGARPYDAVRHLPHDVQAALTTDILRGLLANARVPRAVAEVAVLASQDLAKGISLAVSVRRQAVQAGHPVGAEARLQRRSRQLSDRYGRALVALEFVSEKPGAEAAHLLIEHLDAAADCIPRSWATDDGVTIEPSADEIREGSDRAEAMARSGAWATVVKRIDSSTLRTWLAARTRCC
jgi:hypothetical protein